jgi:hypothetical protein
MVVAETMLVFSAVKGAVDLCKSAVDTCEDVQGIYQGIDQLFNSKDAAEKVLAGEKNKSKKKPKSKMHQLFTRTTNENEDDDLSIGAVAAMVLEQKKLDREIENLGIRIDNRFGRGTWKEILDIREEKIAERKKKEKEAAAAKAAAKNDKRLRDENTQDKIIRYLLEAIKLSVIIAIAYGIFMYVWANRCVEATC